MLSLSRIPARTLALLAATPLLAGALAVAAPTANAAGQPRDALKVWWCISDGSDTFFSFQKRYANPARSRLCAANAGESTIGNETGFFGWTSRNNAGRFYYTQNNGAGPNRVQHFEKNQVGTLLEGDAITYLVIR